MRHVYVKEPAKIILFGEHFVVHGSHAVSLTIDRFVHIEVLEGGEPFLHMKFRGGAEDEHSLDSDVEIVKYVRDLISRFGLPKELQIRVALDFPISAGLGSSAAMAAGLAKALYRLKYGSEAPPDVVYRLADSFERAVHGKPSGIDLNTILAKKVVLYNGYARRVEDIAVCRDMNLVVADTLERRKTGDLVLRVQRVREALKDLFDRFVAISDQLSTLGFKYIKEGRVPLDVVGRLMNINHGLLWSIGVSTKRIDEFVHVALEAGAVGAKLTGAGGGGCIIALVDEAHLNSVAKSLEDRGADVMIVKPYLEV